MAEATGDPFVLESFSRPFRVRSASNRNSSGIPACLAAFCTDAYDQPWSRLFDYSETYYSVRLPVNARFQPV